MSNHKKIGFPKKVLKYVQYFRETDDSILNDHLIKSRDKFGSLLHHAAFHGNTAIVQQLIALGSEVDSVGRDGQTPFMHAVEFGCAVTLAKIFLKAKANIDVVDNNGSSVLQRVFGSYNCDSPLIKLFARKVKTKRTTPNEIATRLIAAGCKMLEAATFRDVEVMQCMLNHGLDINVSSRGKRTALHGAVEMNDVVMVEWLVTRGADVNATNCIEMSALHVAAQKKNKANFTRTRRQSKFQGRSFQMQFIRGENYRDELIEEEAVKCVEILLQHGATFDVNFQNSPTIFDCALDWPSDETVKMLIGQLAVFKMLGTYVSEPVIFCNIESHQSKQPELEEFYTFCLRVLETKLFEDLSLLDLLNASESRLNSLVRRKMFVSRVKTTTSKHKLSKTHAFYYNTLMKRIAKAGRVVKLEDKAILAICKLFRCTYNQCHNFAMEIVSYLKEHELERLVQV